MSWLDGLSWFLLLLGLVFFIAGSLGLLRFPDQFSRLHAVTKADTLGLGLVVLGLSIQSSWRETLLMLLIWLLVMCSGAVSCQLLARFSRDAADAEPLISHQEPGQTANSTSPASAPVTKRAE
ncbi:hypothetical protein GCM10010919_16690 [Alishewanella longhuensis]|uniref:Cation:proton antiporter n=1 Tax=Alishewanella longhuensis TaxID=1091037 RepID=A0ABQ3KZL7_9ALTE|nr:monovalent cation/H(+) antiporter subunit G [Alishewanella longhuensis]GHG67746.1 hypothetical protein GCM10010919_16690 [Alishewanella longhuensis]